MEYIVKIKIGIISLLASSSFLFGAVNHSILPFMNQPLSQDLTGKINDAQKDLIHALLTTAEPSLRVMSFNLLFNVPDAEKQLDFANQWPQRAPRVIEYLKWAHPDLMGSQELQRGQLNHILSAIGDDYGFFGEEIQEKMHSDIPAIFYKKSRLKLLESKTYYFSATPETPSEGPFHCKNTFTYCKFLDLATQKELIALNTHLAFGNLERRYYEACQLKEFLNTLSPGISTLLMGDFNTFPFRQELDLPFYDGDDVLALLEESPMKESMNRAALGHWGPLSSTNFSSETKKPFSSEGTPGVILDHIFVNRYVRVIQHGIDPADVDGYYPSDHFPVIVDVLLVDPC